MNAHMRSGLKLLVLATVLGLAGCATKTQESIATAATTPLSDLNIVRTDIPDMLQQAQRQPYAVPADQSCDVLVMQVHELDEVLGADLDALAPEERKDLVDRGSAVVKKSAIGALQRTAEGVVPFRGWVRKLTGAERHSRHVTAAIAAGQARRAFLKGIGAARGCTFESSGQMAAAED